MAQPDPKAKKLNIEEAYSEFNWLKTQHETRNKDYFLNRQAVQGNFRWPSDWPNHIPKEVENLCKPIVERFTQFLMGKGFTWNLDRPNTLDMREAAERAEKILKVIEDRSKAQLQFVDAAKNGSMLGRSVFKVYRTGKAGAEHACFASVQPDFVYGVTSGGEAIGEYSTLYYSYPIDILEARRLYGDRDYSTEATMGEATRYSPLLERRGKDLDPRERRVPVLEIWTKEHYALVVGENVVFNGENPHKWSDTGEGFIPFIIIDNIRNAGEGQGEADIHQSRVLNERLNWLSSRKSHLVNRYLMPTLVWEGAPTNYSEVLSATIGGGGGIPVRLGGKLYFLAYQGNNPMVTERQAELRRSILETAGMNEMVLDGTTQGSINTGPSLQAQYQPVVGSIEQKRMAWEVGLRSLYAMLLQVQESIGNSKALGEAVINRNPNATSNIEAVPEGDPMADMADGGVLVRLSGKDIRGLRRVAIHWPGVLPKDDLDFSRFELEKVAQGFQSIYTTLEKLGVEQPADEIARIRMENQDPNLRGEKVAEQMRSAAPLVKQQMDQDFQMQQMMMQSQMGGAPGGAPAGPPPMEEPLGSPLEEAGAPPLAERIKALAAAASPELDIEGDEPVLTTGMV